MSKVIVLSRTKDIEVVETTKVRTDQDIVASVIRDSKNNECAVPAFVAWKDNGLEEFFLNIGSIDDCGAWALELTHIHSIMPLDRYLKALEAIIGLAKETGNNE